MGLRNVLRGLSALGLAAAFTFASPGLAQVQPTNPDKAIDADLSSAKAAVPATPAPAPSPAWPTSPAPGAPATNAAAGAGATDAVPPAVNPPPAGTYKQDDLIGAAEGVFGKGAKGLAEMIQGILKKQGEPNGYIVGREASGAIGIGLRYGSGTLYHKIEGQMPVYWTGPSIGFDAGANAGNTFVLVYNLFNTDDLYHRFAAGEGQAYFIGGFTASYLRRGNVVVIPIRAGVGLRLGINAGYMKFSKKHRWVPF